MDSIEDRFIPRLKSGGSSAHDPELDFAEGTLHKPSNIRPNRLFSASVDLILYQAGHLNDPVVTSVIDRIVEILQAK